VNLAVQRRFFEVSAGVTAAGLEPIAVFCSGKERHSTAKADWFAGLTAQVKLCPFRAGEFFRKL
jgi:hypothetical protein